MSGKPQPPYPRFVAKVLFTPTCWLWIGSTSENGYGALSVNRKLVKAHRYSYERHVGPIPEGLELDHLCRVRNCVNPLHLEPVTRRENARRGLKGVLHTHCAKGHAMTEGNTMWHRIKGRTPARRCRICHLAGLRESYQKRKAAST